MARDYYQIIGKNIAHYRKKRHWNQEGFAMKANVSRAYISQIEAKNIKKFPSLSMLIHLSNTLGIEPYQLFLEDYNERLSHFSRCDDLPKCQK